MLLLFFRFFRAAAPRKKVAWQLNTRPVAQKIHKIWSLPFLWQNTVHTGHHSNGEFFVCQKTWLEKKRFCSMQNVRFEPTEIQKMSDSSGLDFRIDDEATFFFFLIVELVPPLSCLHARGRTAAKLAKTVCPSYEYPRCAVRRPVFGSTSSNWRHLLTGSLL